VGLMVFIQWVGAVKLEAAWCVMLSLAEFR
jgi:hypothetical protein